MSGERCEHGWRDAIDCDVCRSEKVKDERIAELEKAIAHARVMADHGVHGEMGAVEACDEIHRALTAVVPIK